MWNNAPEGWGDEGREGWQAQYLTAWKQTTHQNRKGLSRSCPAPFHPFVMPGAFTCRSPWTQRPVLGRLALLTTEKGVYLPLTPSSARTAPPPRGSLACSPNDGSLVWEQRNYVNECIPSHMHPETGQACLCLVGPGNKCTVALKPSPFISLRPPLFHLFTLLQIAQIPS